MFDNTNILQKAKLSQFAKELPNFISYGQLKTFTLDTESWSKKNELIWLVPKNTLSNVDNILFNIPDNYEKYLSDKQIKKLNAELEKGNIEEVNKILQDNIHLSVDTESGLIVSSSYFNRDERKFLIEDPVEISTPLTIPQALELAKDLDDEYFYGMLCFDRSNNTIVNPLHPMVALELTQNDFLENHSEKLYKVVYYKLKANFKELPNIASIQTGPQQFRGNISKIFDVISTAYLNKIEGTITLTNEDTADEDIKRDITKVNRGYQEEVLKSIPMIDLMVKGTITFNEFGTACQKYQREHHHPTEYENILSENLLKDFRELIGVNRITDALTNLSSQTTNTVCITSSKLPLSNLYAVIPQQAIVNRIAYPYYGVSLFENTETKSIEEKHNSSAYAVGKGIAPMLSSNISLYFRNQDAVVEDDRLEGFIPYTCRTVSLKTLNEWNSICTGQEPRDTIKGLRVMNVSNAGSPLNTYILLNGWYDWTRECIKESFNIYKGHEWVK